MKTEKWLKTFTDLLIKQFNPILEDKGFKNTKKEIDKNGFSIIFRKQDLYIYFGCSVHPLDYPYEWLLLLGEGSDEMPESDWNSIPLWGLFDSKTLEKEKKLFILNLPSDLSQLLSKDDIISEVKRAFKLFIKFAGGFLNNELEVFKKKKGQNQEREPYTIFTPDSKGKYKVIYDKTSEKLKKRFS